jgi:hypothetical protein
MRQQEILLQDTLQQRQHVVSRSSLPNEAQSRPLQCAVEYRGTGHNSEA